MNNDNLTPEEILRFGDHLYEVKQLLLAGGLVIAEHVGCIKQHVGVEEAESTVEYLKVLSRVIHGLNDQLAALAGQAERVEAEVKDLEATLALEAVAIKDHPGAGGYL